MAELTKLDLYKSAFNAALETVANTDPHQLATFKLTRFNQEKQNPKNWDYWQQIFDQQRMNLSQLSRSKAPSEGK